MDTTVYIPNLDGGRRLLRTLETLAHQSRAARLVVVDNGSTDDSIPAVRSEFPDVDVVALGTNRGFGAALNRAVGEYPSDVLLFLNNDVECAPDFVEAMVEQLDRRTGMVAGVLLEAERPEIIDSAGILADSTLLAFDYLHGEHVDALLDAPAPLGPTGGAALIRRDAFASVGGFDERIFAYLEDVDLALRLRSAGIRCRLARHARAVHRHSATLGSGSPRKNMYMGWSRGYLLRRYGVLRRPIRAARALAGEAVIAVGQIAIDRTVTGIAGRARGWREAASLPRNPIPERDLIDITLGDALARRSKRRSLAWRSPTPSHRSS